MTVTENRIRNYLLLMRGLILFIRAHIFSRAGPFNRGSYTSAHVLLNLLNVLRKRDKLRGLVSMLSLWQRLNKLNTTRARMFDSIYHMTLLLKKKTHLRHENVKILQRPERRKIKTLKDLTINKATLRAKKSQVEASDSSENEDCYCLICVEKCTSMQLKRKAKLPTVIGLTTNHAV